MSEEGEGEAKRQLSTSERLLGVDKAKLNARLLNTTYNICVYPAVWFRENVRIFFQLHYFPVNTMGAVAHIWYNSDS